ncbi:MAG: EVE domain-containing protein [Polyangiaceae bacterium]|nr:EVE domain-containing protein [Polyangiaceae bacterium]
MQHYLVKSEPTKYAFSDLTRDRKTCWDGVRNFEARNNLRAMKEGDLLLFYHSNEDKAVVGVAKVVRAAYPDPSATDGDWSAVDVAPVAALGQPVTLAQIKADEALADIALLKRSRLSVVPVSKAHFARILKLGKTRL